MKTPARLISLVACSALGTCLLGGCRKFSPWEVYRTEIPKTAPGREMKDAPTEQHEIAQGPIPKSGGFL